MRSNHMMHTRWLLVVVFLSMVVGPSRAGIIFGKHSKPDPKQRVPQLIAVVKTESDEDKRAEAARELRNYDPAAFPELVPVLLDLVQNDPKPAVRAEAVQSLAKLRPISQVIGEALEEATKDKSIRVRWQARSALLSYRMSGYRTPPKPEEAPQPAPSGLIPGLPRIPSLFSSKSEKPPAGGKTAPLLGRETAPPPLALPAPNAPAGQPPTAAVPAPAKTPAGTSNEGPDLPPIRD
jgi:hypothetical protein